MLAMMATSMVPEPNRMGLEMNIYTFYPTPAIVYASMQENISQPSEPALSPGLYRLLLSISLALHKCPHIHAELCVENVT